VQSRVPFTFGMSSFFALFAFLNPLLLFFFGLFIPDGTRPGIFLNTMSVGAETVDTVDGVLFFWREIVFSPTNFEILRLRRTEIDQMKQPTQCEWQVKMTPHIFNRLYTGVSSSVGYLF